jgi:hypothetical protein
MSFRIRGLTPGQFEPLLVLSDSELVARGMRRELIDEPHASPCRVTLADADPGEHVILLPFAHQTADSPYRAGGPIYVRERAREPFDRIDELPPVFSARMLSVRAYDAHGMMIHADIADSDPRELFTQFFSDPATDYLHVHYARRGCYSCRVDRA